MKPHPFRAGFRAGLVKEVVYIMHRLFVVFVYLYVCMSVCMHVCMDGWMDVWMYRCMDVWM